MKNRHTSSPAQAASTRARVHTFLAIVGVMAAIVCAFILLQDAPVAQLHTSRISIPEVSKLTNIMQIAASWKF